LIFLLFRNYLSSKGGYGEINDIFGGTIDVLICICYVCKATGSFFILEHSGRKPLWGDGVLKDSKVEWSQTKQEHDKSYLLESTDDAVWASTQGDLIIGCRDDTFLLPAFGS